MKYCSKCCPETESLDLQTSACKQTNQNISSLILGKCTLYLFNIKTAVDKTEYKLLPFFWRKKTFKITFVVAYVCFFCASIFLQIKSDLMYKSIGF